MIRDREKILNFVKITPILSIILISISLIFVAIFGIHKYFNDDIKNEILKVKSNIIYQAKKDVKATYSLIDSINKIVSYYTHGNKKEIFKRIIQVLSKIETAKDKRNIIIITTKGHIVYSTNRIIFDTNQYKRYRAIINLAKQSSLKIIQYHEGNRHLIFSYYKPLKLVILQEISLKDIDKLIQTTKKDINKVVKLVIEQFLLTALIFVLIGLIIVIYLTNIIKKTFEQYDTKLKAEKEKAEKAAKIKSEFLANMSHEIRTPLNAMFGFIKILKEKEHDEESKKYLNIIEKSGENLLVIINDILDFSKLESGKFHIEKISFNPKEEIEIIHNLFISKASEKNILLQINEKNLDYNIISDPTRIKQVIANLLSNAIKFTPNNKKITLNIEYDSKKELLKVEVIDEGIGIPKDKLRHIFEAFTQADTSTTRKYGGSGLGLTISYRLVELLGGKLEVESEVNKGSRFYFSIPAKKDGRAKEIEKIDTIQENITYDYHLLLVEDNVANQLFMKVMLQKMGLTFDLANNGKEAIEKFKNNKYDFILMDENMPEMNGIEATKIIRNIEREQNLNHTIIIALTANAMDGDKEKFILAGMDYYLSKPLDISKFKLILEDIKYKI